MARGGSDNNRSGRPFGSQRIDDGSTDPSLLPRQTGTYWAHSIPLLETGLWVAGEAWYLYDYQVMPM